jgi:RNA polymerase sigma-70 factor, ECF subfamily
MADPLNPNPANVSEDAPNANSPDANIGTTSDADSTVDLLTRARAGDRGALEQLLAKVRPALTRWAHGRLPRYARGMSDTVDLVQETILTTFQKLDAFPLTRTDALETYLRQAILNRIRDEVRRVERRESPGLSDSEVAVLDESPLEAAIQSEAFTRYQQALTRLAKRDRELIIQRIEMQWSYKEIARTSGASTDAARMAVVRAMKRLADLMREPQQP